MCSFRTKEFSQWAMSNERHTSNCIIEIISLQSIQIERKRGRRIQCNENHKYQLNSFFAWFERPCCWLRHSTELANVFLIVRTAYETRLLMFKLNFPRCIRHHSQPLMHLLMHLKTSSARLMRWRNVRMRFMNESTWFLILNIYFQHQRMAGDILIRSHCVNQMHTDECKTTQISHLKYEFSNAHISFREKFRFRCKTRWQTRR